MLNIVVCVKAVPDPKDSCKISIDPVSKTLNRCDISMVLNPLDKNAMEAALKLKEQYGAHITVLSMGPPQAAQIVKECLALGGDQGFLLSDRAFGGADAYATAFTLASGIKKVGKPDIIFCGMASSDGATEWVGPQIATFLDMPVVTMLKEIVNSAGDCWQVKASLKDGYRLLEVDLPALFTVTRDLNEPKALSFSGIIKARKKEIAVWSKEDLGVPEESLGLPGSPTIVSNMTTTDNKREVEIITGSREEMADQLVMKLADAGAI